MKYISIIGSTGSIGTQTLDIVRSNKDLKITALAAGTSIDLLEKQAREFHPFLHILLYSYLPDEVSTLLPSVHCIQQRSLAEILLLVFLTDQYLFLLLRQKS